MFYRGVVRFSNGLARVSSASSVVLFEVGTSGGTFAPCAAMRHHRICTPFSLSLFSHRTGTMRLFPRGRVSLQATRDSTRHEARLYHHVASFCTCVTSDALSADTASSMSVRFPGEMSDNSRGSFISTPAKDILLHVARRRASRRPHPDYEGGSREPAEKKVQ